MKPLAEKVRSTHTHTHTLTHYIRWHRRAFVRANAHSKTAELFCGSP